MKYQTPTNVDYVVVIGDVQALVVVTIGPSNVRVSQSMGALLDNKAMQMWLFISKWLMMGCGDSALRTKYTRAQKNIQSARFSEIGSVSINEIT